MKIAVEIAGGGHVHDCQQIILQ